MAVNLGKNPLLYSPLKPVALEALDQPLTERRFEHFSAFKGPLKHIQHVLVDNQLIVFYH